ncbi:hypothetical protein HIM_05646 [Hirsutella minnesotensis 3608]|uniref:Extracellular membrane protein CFEM domain-containing protein n=1 Tax=Hirsutella minnesotensis 3608 TaxID=1043627 RepID=A0A0F7ZP56_9HYPO|nr:hypothetical protein HIM_05646 [Hirsutella minnesotensis 3608]
MKLLASIAALFALASSAQACQCISSVGVNVSATQKCCREAGGASQGNQCPAGRISERLSDFAQCCRRYDTATDCGCPRGCAARELAARRRAEGGDPPTEEEITALMATYA